MPVLGGSEVAPADSVPAGTGAIQRATRQQSDNLTGTPDLPGCLQDPCPACGCDDVEFPGLFVLVGPDGEGEPFLLADFLKDNPELTEYERNACAVLERGEFLSFGGGAAPVLTLKRIA